jgi:hypothetical protein
MKPVQQELKERLEQVEAELALTGLQADVLSGGCLGVVPARLAAAGSRPTER